MRQNGRELKPVDEQQTEPLSLEELRELDEQHVVELPDREAISVVNATTVVSVGTAASAGLLPEK
jgi:hypothetical protein